MVRAVNSVGKHKYKQTINKQWLKQQSMNRLTPVAICPNTLDAAPIA
jgi:hypothetical protein